MGFRNMYIAASAGTGKTYQLVNRFVALLSLQQLAGGKPEVGRLIAVTFTRKAAGEFKERILAALAEAAQSEESAQRFWEERILPTITDAHHGICPGSPLPPLPPLHAFFTTMLRALTDAFSELKLSTLDSFFQQMVNTLAPELGLHSFTTLDKAQQVTMNRRSLDLTYLHQSNRPQPELEAAIGDCFPKEERKNMPDANIFELVSLYHEVVLNAPHALWGGEADAMSEEELARFGLTREDVTLILDAESFRDAVHDLRLHLPPNSAKNWQDYVSALANIGGSLPPSPKQGWEDWCRQNGMEQLLAARRPLYWRRLLSRTRALCELIREFEQRYNRDVRSRGLYSFNDVLQLLRRRLDDESMLLMEERTDARLAHWLLDEFQDTSWAQYDILRDLLLNRAAEDEGSVFMVGDAKQSIYQFRGGDPRIFLQARHELFGLQAGEDSREESAQMPLDTSYRSTQPVLDFANELFHDIDQTARNACNAARRTWKELGYQRHLAAPHMARQAGCAVIYRAARNDVKDEQHPPIPEVDDRDYANIARTLACILADKRPAGVKNVPGAAILVDSHTHETALFNALTLLQPHYGFAGPLVICNDNEVGHDSPAGKALTQFFRWLSTPADEASLSLLRLTPLWDALVNTFGQQELWESLHTQLAATGVSGLLRRLADICPALMANDFLRQRFGVWLQAADTFDNLGGSLNEWIATIEKLTVREEPQGNAIRIMTIHKAKGLEFDMVLLPQFTTGPMADSTHAHLLQQSDEHGNPTAVLLKPSRDALAEAPAVREALYTPWQAEQEFSSFCELYVAVTRARYATYVVIPSFPPPRTKKEPTREMLILEGACEGESLAGMMVQLAARAGYSATEELNLNIADCLCLRGDAHWEKDWQQRHSATVPPTAEKEAEEVLCFNFPILTRSTPSGRAAAARSHSTASPRSYGTRSNSGATFGTLVHATFEQVEWLEEGSQPAFHPAASEEEATAQQVVLHALAEPAVRVLFLRPSAPCRLFREQGIEALREGRQWVSGQIDRLVVEYADSTCQKPLRAQIIDFKSDRCEATALKPEYAPQMREYREMVALAFNLPPEAVGVTLIHAPRQGHPAPLPYGPGEL